MNRTLLALTLLMWTLFGVYRVAAWGSREVVWYWHRPFPCGRPTQVDVTTHDGKPLELWVCLDDRTF